MPLTAAELAVLLEKRDRRIAAQSALVASRKAFGADTWDSEWTLHLMQEARKTLLIRTNGVKHPRLLSGS